MDNTEIPLALILVSAPLRTDALIRAFAEGLTERTLTRLGVPLSERDGSEEHDLRVQFYEDLVATLQEIASNEVALGVGKLTFDPADQMQDRDQHGPGATNIDYDSPGWEFGDDEGPFAPERP